MYYSQVGLFLQRMHETKGVEFFMNASMVELQGDNGAVQRVLLKDGRVLEVKRRFASGCLDHTFINELARQNRPTTLFSY